MTRERITELMQRNRWTIDRTAFELNCTTFDLRWLLNNYKPESKAQQIRLDEVVRALAAIEALGPTRMTLMRRVPEPTGARPRSDYCKNNHWLGDRNSHYMSRSGKRMCYQCIEDRRELRGSRLSAAKSAIGTLNARGLRDVEIARLTGISNASISAWRLGESGLTADRLTALQQLVAVTNDLTGRERERTRQFAPHPLIDEIRARFVSVGERVAA